MPDFKAGSLFFFFSAFWQSRGAKNESAEKWWAQPLLVARVCAFVQCPPRWPKSGSSPNKGGDEISRSPPKFAKYFFAIVSPFRIPRHRGAARPRWQSPRARNPRGWSLVGDAFFLARMTFLVLHNELVHRFTRPPGGFADKHSSALSFWSVDSFHNWFALPKPQVLSVA